MKDYIAAVNLLESRPISTIYGAWNEHLFLYQDQQIVVLSLGDLTAGESLVRVHSTCFSAHYLASVECDCREQLAQAFSQISASGCGAIVFLDQDGRGNGHAALMRAAKRARKVGGTQSEAYRSLGYPADARSFVGAGLVLRALDVTSVRMLTNNPRKIAGVEAAGVAVAGRATMVIRDLAQGQLRHFYELKKLEDYEID